MKFEREEKLSIDENWQGGVKQKGFSPREEKFGDVERQQARVQR